MMLARALLVLGAVAPAACYSSPRALGRVPVASALGVRPRTHVARRPLAELAPAPVARVHMSDAAASSDSSGGLAQTLKVGVLFGVWYAFNIVYNISNKKILSAFPCAQPRVRARHAPRARLVHKS